MKNSQVEKEKKQSSEKWIKLGTKFSNFNTNSVDVIDPQTSFNFGTNSFKGIYCNKVLPKSEVSIRIKWVAVSIPGQGENIILKDIVIPFREEYLKKLKDCFYVTFSLDSGLMFPLGKYRVELYQNDVFAISQDFCVVEGYSLILSSSPKMQNPDISFKKGTKKIYMSYKTPFIMKGETRVEWTFKRKINSEKEENVLLSFVEVKSEAYNQITHDLDAEKLPPGYCRVEIYSKKNEKDLKLEAYKEFIIRPTANVEIGTDISFQPEVKIKNDFGKFFPPDVKAIVGMIKTEFIFPKGTSLDICWIGLDVEKLPPNSIIFESSEKMKDDFNFAHFALQKPSENNFQSGIYEVKIKIGDLIEETRIFFIDMHFETELGTEILKEKIPGIKEPTREFSKQTERIFGMCKCNKVMRKGTPFQVILRKKSKKEGKEIQELMVEQAIDMYEDCNVLVFAFGKPKEGFPVGDLVCELKLFEEQIQLIEFKIVE